MFAIIPARGGSKGLPRKNVRFLAGHPLIGYSVQQALRTRHVQRVLVSTDDAEIAEIATRYGAEIIWRPSEISGDMARSEDALIHALHQIQETEGSVPDITVFVQCTTPLTRAEDIDATVEMLMNMEADSAFTVAPFHGFVWRRDSHGEASAINHDAAQRQRRQDREPQYLENGAVYAMNTDGFLEAQHRFFGKTVMHVMPPERSLEIDTITDLRMAEVLFQERQQQGRIDQLPDEIGAIVFDFDGVFTDNRVWVTEEGREVVLCSRADGWGIGQLGELGIPMLVLSTERNPVVAARCDKLGLECIHGTREKMAALQTWLCQRNVNLSDVVFVGNDVNDETCLRAVGCPVVVGDAHPQVQSVAKLVLTTPGGGGAVRELADLILQKWEESPHAGDN